MADKLSRDQVLGRLGSIRLLSLDVDGVLTDGGLYYTDDGHQLRKFNVKDGMGIKRARDAGVEVAIISAGVAPSVQKRGEVLGLKYVFTGVKDKLETLKGICRELEIGLDQVAHVGDDLNDLPVLEAVGFPVAVADAIDETRQAAVFVTERVGGAGAVRELCDLIVAARA
jgi:3-deoxy-D-manno-octulosonate 8-phosphate phosphatase (KDO 8-P phosphatase)